MGECDDVILILNLPFVPFVIHETMFTVSCYRNGEKSIKSNFIFAMFAIKIPLLYKLKCSHFLRSRMNSPRRKLKDISDVIRM